MSAKKRRCSSAAGIGDAIRPTVQSDGRSAQTNERAAPCGIVARLLFGSAGGSSTSLRPSKAFGSPPRKDAGDIPTTNAARGPHGTCGRTKERDRFSSRVKTLPENPRRTAATTGIRQERFPPPPTGSILIEPVRLRDLRRRTSRPRARRSGSRRSRPSRGAPSRGRPR